MVLGPLLAATLGGSENIADGALALGLLPSLAELAGIERHVGIRVGQVLSLDVAAGLLGTVLVTGDALGCFAGTRGLVVARLLETLALCVCVDLGGRGRFEALGRLAVNVHGVVVTVVAAVLFVVVVALIHEDARGSIVFTDPTRKQKGGELAKKTLKTLLFATGAVIHRCFVFLGHELIVLVALGGLALDGRLFTAGTLVLVVALILLIVVTEEQTTIRGDRDLLLL